MVSICPVESKKQCLNLLVIYETGVSDTEHTLAGNLWGRPPSPTPHLNVTDKQQNSVILKARYPPGVLKTLHAYFLVHLFVNHLSGFPADSFLVLPPTCSVPGPARKTFHGEVGVTPNCEMISLSDVAARGGRVPPWKCHLGSWEPLPPPVLY